MKIILDTDGTMTDFNNFIAREAIPYFEERYQMKVKNPESLEIQDIFDMDNFFAQKYNVSLQEAKKYSKKALEEFWVHPRFLKYSLFNKFRFGLSQYVKEMLKDGHEVQIHTSRDKTTDKNSVGKLSRLLVRLQYLLNGIYLSEDKFNFYANDEEKIKGIIDSKPDIVFEDKPEIIKALRDKGLKCVCIEGNHNLNVENEKNVFKDSGESYESIIASVERLLGKKKMNYFRKAAKSDLFYAKVSHVKFLILDYFEPIILNGENMIFDDDKPIIYAPNHRSTLDPLVINAVINKHIHWAALLRFFEGKDSIFNNSKNPFLCNITASSFKNLEFIPIERKRDNPNANNVNSIFDMLGFLQVNKKVGIFPEGTTLKSDEDDFGIFDPSFVLMATAANATIVPITVLWFKDKNNKKRVILNFGMSINVKGKNKEEIYEEYLEAQKKQLEENKKMCLLYLNDKTLKRTLLKSSKIYYN